MPVSRIYVEKKPPYDVEAQALCAELRTLLGAEGLRRVRLLCRYDVEGLDGAALARALPVVFSEPQVDLLHEALPESDAGFAVEYLPGQFDQRAESCAECVQLLTQGERPKVRTAKAYLLYGELTDAELARIKRYFINPVESREAALEPRESLAENYPEPPDVPTLEGFRELDRAGLEQLVRDMGLAMDADDAEACREYFRAEGRDPSLTELRVLDTYWSDHCRHTTFGTIIDEVEIEDAQVRRAYERCREIRRELGREEEPLTLMELATLGARYLKKTGQLTGLDESEEINACSVKVTADVDGREEPWLLMFKNETHNHPTEIEPFGGAATCIGGAIRDPLSGRAYVYQAMRVTGAGDPRTPVSETLPGKLPQRKIVTTAAAGYSSYGNQIGLATGFVDEYYHPGYVAKRMEIGAVIAAAPERNVVRSRPEPGDVVILLGGRTGRDGCGGATGSSKAHGLHSLESCGAEVQKGNAPVERKLQRLFRQPEATRLIRRCNDFGAGGVSVAIGELADGLSIDLDRVPRKYEGLDGTELAISESQERMAVVVAAGDAARFLELAAAENLEATVVAEVTKEPRLRMRWRGELIADLSRDFLASNGAEKHTRVRVPEQAAAEPAPAGAGTLGERLAARLSSLQACSRRGLGARFDSTIGAGTVVMPYGGRYQRTPAQCMIAKLPVPGETRSCSAMACGFEPEIAQRSPYRGAWLAVVESVARLVASGLGQGNIYLSFQEYFERLRREPERWGKPFAALLGALEAQLGLGVAAIGGKDSMSGSFEALDVPPTLVSFAVGYGSVEDVVTPELKAAGNRLALFRAEPFDAAATRAMFGELTALMRRGEVVSCWAVDGGGIAAGLCKMAFGNRLGVELDAGFDAAELFSDGLGCMIAETSPGCAAGRSIGRVTDDYTFSCTDERIDMQRLQDAWERTLEGVMPELSAPGQGGERVRKLGFEPESRPAPAVRTARPRALIPVFPGTNCEYDTARALKRAGAEPEILVIRNLSPRDVAESVERVARELARSQMLVLPGGFSGGDEPDGSAKLMAAFFRSTRLTDAVHELLYGRDGLILGICNGFQALIKLGLVPFGRIVETDAGCPTLTYNMIGRHQSRLVRTRVASTLSPWLSRCRVGDVHTLAISHGEGRFVCPEPLLTELGATGRIAAQYVDASGEPTMDLGSNPNGSALAVEALSSPDGRVLGKMGHTERSGPGLYRNIPGLAFQPLFEGGVDYFR